MTFTRLLVLGQTHPPEAEAAHLASAGMLPVHAGISNVLPNLEGAAVWVRTGGATRLLNAGATLDLLSPGPLWMNTVPGHLLGRKLICTTVGELEKQWKGYGIFRLPEQQYGVMGRQSYYGNPSEFIRALVNGRRRYGRFDDVHVLASAPVDYNDRYRFFITNGEITAGARVPVYRRNHKFTITGEDLTAEARHFARTVADTTVWHQPPGFRIDVGQAPGGDWNLISAGPSWSADFLEANPSGVVASLLAAQQPDHDHWKWTPDEFFQSTILRAHSASAVVQ